MSYTVAADLPRHRADVPTDQPGDLSVAKAIDVIFSYTRALFYGKMVVVHTVPSRGLVVWCLYSTRVLYELLFFSFLFLKVLRLIV